MLIAEDLECGFRDTIAGNELISGVKLEVSLGYDRVICPEDSLYLIPVANSSNVDYSWSTGEYSNQIYVLKGGEYWVLGKDSICTDRDTIDVILVEAPPSTGYIESICLGEIAILKAKIDSGFAYWHHNGSTETILYTDTGGVFSYTYRGEYYCLIEDSITIIQKPFSTNIWFPNSFTPDADGLNDEFLPVGVGIEDYELYIFNRWGELLFETRDEFEGWTGETPSGVIAQSGVYVYRVTFKDKCDDIFNRTVFGHVTLVK